MIAILITGSQNPWKFNNWILQVRCGAPLNWILRRIHYNYDDNYEEKAERGGGERRETSLRHAYVISSVQVLHMHCFV